MSPDPVKASCSFRRDGGIGFAVVVDDAVPGIVAESLSSVLFAVSRPEVLDLLKGCRGVTGVRKVAARSWPAMLGEAFARAMALATALTYFLPAL